MKAKLSILLLLALFACKKEQPAQPAKKSQSVTENTINIRMSTNDNFGLFNGEFYKNGAWNFMYITNPFPKTTETDVYTYTQPATDSVIVRTELGVVTHLFPDGSVNYVEWSDVTIYLYINGVFKTKVTGEGMTYLRYKD